VEANGSLQHNADSLRSPCRTVELDRKIEWHTLLVLLNP
jgi:hypothetical protein